MAEPEVIGPSSRDSFLDTIGVRDIEPSNVVATTHNGMEVYGSIEEQIASGILVPDEDGKIILHGMYQYKDEDGNWGLKFEKDTLSDPNHGVDDTA